MTVRMTLSACLLITAAVATGCQPNQLLGRYNGQPYGPHISRMPEAGQPSGDPFQNESASSQDPTGTRQAPYHPTVWNKTHTVHSDNASIVVAGHEQPTASPDKNTGPFATRWQPTQRHATNSPTIVTPSF